jgi:transketolase (EC 2.2.1.1)
MHFVSIFDDCELSKIIGKGVNMGDIDKLCINTLRFLAVDAVEQARSGHPGLPLGAAPMAYVLWDKFLRHNPKDPHWINRDRFILSAGHGSALLYALLHVYDYGLPVEELKKFRQFGSLTPGHPEYGVTPGVEATTGPLGQGFAMGIGIAMAEKFLSDSFNLPDYPVIDHYTYAIVSDGDLMEGISSEAASLAGTLHLSKLIYLYADNHISLEGGTDIAFTENVQERFEAYGWHVLRVPDGNDLKALEDAILTAQTEQSKPKLIIVRSHLGYASPKQDTAAAHGEPLGKDALLKTKQALDWPPEPSFYIPEPAMEHFSETIRKGAELEKDWDELLEKYRLNEPTLADQFDQMINGELPNEWKDKLPLFDPKDGPVATREASGKVMNALSKALHTPGGAPHHFFIGGSADLNPSTKTTLIGYGDFGFSKDDPHNIHFGVREHAMGAIANGIALHSHFIPYTATFFVFSDYMRPAIRLAALMKTHVIFVFTHDSIALGEDGPTHEPVEHLMSLRIIPDMTVIRPADANETVAAWELAIERKGPVSLVFTRQALPVLDPEKHAIKEGVYHGAYILEENESSRPDIVLIGTGSEVALVLEAHKELTSMGIATRVVSMPSWEIFEEQDPRYKLHILPEDIPVIAMEAGVTIGWCRYVRGNGAVIGLDRFGASGPGKTVYSKLGFSVENVVKQALMVLGR